MKRRVWARRSVREVTREVRRGGQPPSPWRAMAATAAAIRTEVRGSARRLVRRKYLGKLWKRIQTRGAVKTWQETARAAACQILRIG